MNPFESIAAIIQGAPPALRPEIPARVSATPKRPLAPKDKTAGRRKPARPQTASPTAAGGPDRSADLAAAVAPALRGAAPPPPPPAAAGENGIPSRAGRLPESGPPAGSAGEEGAADVGAYGEAVPFEPRASAPRKRRATASANGGGRGPARPVDDDALDMELAFLPQTDLGNAERFVGRFRETLRYVPNFGWYFWDGKRWSRKGADEFVQRAEHETVRAIQDEAAAVEAADRDFVVTTKNVGKANEEEVSFADTLRGWGRASEAANRITPIAKNARAYLSLEHAAFDADPYKINLNNCTLTVRRPHQIKDDDPHGGKLIIRGPHDPRDFITKISPVDFLPDAQCPLFDAFFARVQPDTAQRRFLMAWHGYSLTGDAEEQKLAVYWGRGRNGKGTLIEACAYIGGDYAESVGVETFLTSTIQKGGGQATPDLAKLPGVRFLRTGEPDKGAKLGEALIKRVTGGDPIDARNLNKEFFTFFAQFKLTIACNYRPQVAGTDEGIWGRMILVPWLVFIPKEERDPFLKMKLRAEASGILNRLLHGLRDYLEHGLVQGEEIEKATAQYRRESDAVGRFLEVCTIKSDGDRVQSSVLHELYLAWAKCNDGPNYSNKGFTGILADRGLQRIQNNNMFWLDIKAVRTVNDFVDHDGKPLTRPAAGVDGTDAAAAADLAKEYEM